MRWVLLPRLGSPLPAARCRRLATVGLILYALSWITPSIDGRQLGARVFVDAAVMGAQLTFRAVSIAGFIAGLSLLCGWLANFSIFLRLSVRARWVWIAAPWVPFAVLLVKHGPAPSPVSLLCFYPWAIGIGLIHFANIADAQGAGANVTGSTGQPTGSDRR
jgi:hypothetical protein